MYYYRIAQFLNFKQHNVFLPKMFEVWIPGYGLGVVTELIPNETKQSAISDLSIKAMVDTLDYIVYNQPRDTVCISKNGYILVNNAETIVSEESNFSDVLNEPGPDMTHLTKPMVNSLFELYVPERGWYKIISTRMEIIKSWLSL